MKPNSIQILRGCCSRYPAESLPSHVEIPPLDPLAWTNNLINCKWDKRLPQNSQSVLEMPSPGWWPCFWEPIFSCFFMKEMLKQTRDACRIHLWEPQICRKKTLMMKTNEIMVVKIDKPLHEWYPFFLPQPILHRHFRLISLFFASGIIISDRTYPSIFTKSQKSYSGS